MGKHEKLMLAVRSGVSLDDLRPLIRLALAEQKAALQQKLEHFQNGRR